MIGGLFLAAHLGELQFLPGLLQAWSIGILGYLAGGEKVYPLLQGNLRPTVEVVHLENIVFGVQLIDLADAKLLTLERRQAQHVAIMDAAKLCLAVIHEVLPLSEIEIDDVNRIDLLHIVIVGAAVNVLRDQLGRAEEYALEVGIF